MVHRHLDLSVESFGRKLSQLFILASGNKELQGDDKIYRSITSLASFGQI
ncbi:hypothetical protein VCR4J2_60034 [Vibrio coralliirubri]|nr:hypothetical protein VCR4J2_60034 [Vibrio coralliirubri]